VEKKSLGIITCLSIILLFGAGHIPYSYGLSCAGPTIEEEFSLSQWVFLGKFISETDVGIFSDNTVLDFKVIENYKGATSPTIKVLNNPGWRHSFSADEVIIFAGADLFGNPELFLCTNSGETSEKWISKVRELSGSEIDFVLPPRVQINNGVENGDILCREGLVLVFKAVDYSPACVKLSTAQKLLERGWTKLGNP